MTAAPAAPGAVAAAAALPAPAPAPPAGPPKKLATASSCTSGQASSAACATRLRCRQRRYTLAAARATWPDSSARVAAAATLYLLAQPPARQPPPAPPSSAFLSEASPVVEVQPWHKGRESGQFHPSTAGLGCASPHVRFLHLRCQAAVPCRSLPTPPTCAARALAASAARRLTASTSARARCLLRPEVCVCGAQRGVACLRGEGLERH